MSNFGLELIISKLKYTLGTGLILKFTIGLSADPSILGSCYNNTIQQYKTRTWLCMVMDMVALWEIDTELET